MALRGILEIKGNKKGSKQVLKIQREISEMYFTQAHLKQSQQYHMDISRKGRAEVMEQKSFDPPIQYCEQHSLLYIISADLPGLHASQSKIHSK